MPKLREPTLAPELLDDHQWIGQEAGQPVVGINGLLAKAAAKLFTLLPPVIVEGTSPAIHLVKTGAPASTWRILPSSSGHFLINLLGSGSPFFISIDAVGGLLELGRTNPDQLDVNGDLFVAGSLDFGTPPVFGRFMGGANLNTPGRFVEVNGTGNAQDVISSPASRWGVPGDGKLIAVTYSTENLALTTTLVLHVNGVAEATLNITPGFDPVHTFDINVPVSKNDTVELEYDSNDPPGNTTVSIAQVS